jgi:sugar O-acyltransferase (sialic acid O-acetyltransferase NeuD family)
MIKILEVPKVGNSDVYLKFNSIASNGKPVKVGEIVCEFESSKTIFEFEVEIDGFFYSFYSDAESVHVSEPFGIISEEHLTDKEFIAFKDSVVVKEISRFSSVDVQSDLVVTNGARLLMEKYNLDVKDFNQKVINERVVNEFIKSADILNGTNDYIFQDNDVLIFGIGGHAGMCIDIIHSMDNLNLRGYLDERESRDNKYRLSYFGKISDLDSLIKRGLKNMVIGTAFFENIAKREKLFRELSLKINIVTIIHSSAIIERSAKIGTGCQIMAGAIIGSNVVISDNCIVNSGAIISHDSIIGHSSHVSPGACIAGSVKVGDRVLLGMCSTVFLGLTISSGSVIRNNESIIQSK